MNYLSALKYLDSFYNYEKSRDPKARFLNLDRITKLADYFGNPQLKYNTIHITGTKGKGSTACMIAGILREAGYKVGLYTSPHINDARERIKIDGKMIAESEFASIMGRIKNAVDGFGESFKPSFFEIYTAIAFLYFREKNADFGVFEVGMGGRFDATNIIRPIAACVTPISHDHTKELGPRLTDIAGEKAEIIKNGTTLIMARQDKNVASLIRKKAKAENAVIYEIGKDITFRSRGYTEAREILDVKSVKNTFSKLELHMIGEHQLENAAMASGIADVLIMKGFKISKDAVFKGVKSAKAEGRCEIIRARPRVLLDGAHNKASARALKQTLLRNFKFNNIILILAVSGGKDIKGIVEELEPISGFTIITKADNPRAENPPVIRKYFKKKFKTAIAKNINEAYKTARKLSSDGDIIVITGSFYILGQFKNEK